jgi:hypothetical protein
LNEAAVLLTRLLVFRHATCADALAPHVSNCGWITHTGAQPSDLELTWVQGDAHSDCPSYLSYFSCHTVTSRSPVLLRAAVTMDPMNASGATAMALTGEAVLYVPASEKGFVASSHGIDAYARLPVDLTDGNTGSGARRPTAQLLHRVT